MNILGHGWKSGEQIVLPKGQTINYFTDDDAGLPFAVIQYLLANFDGGRALSPLWSQTGSDWKPSDDDADPADISPTDDLPVWVDNYRYAAFSEAELNALRGACEAVNPTLLEDSFIVIGKEWRLCDGGASCPNDGSPHTCTGVLGLAAAKGEPINMVTCVINEGAPAPSSGGIVLRGGDGDYIAADSTYYEGWRETAIGFLAMSEGEKISYWTGLHGTAKDWLRLDGEIQVWEQAFLASQKIYENKHGLRRRSRTDEDVLREVSPDALGLIIEGGFHGEDLPSELTTPDAGLEGWIRDEFLHRTLSEQAAEWAKMPTQIRNQAAGIDEVRSRLRAIRCVQYMTSGLMSPDVVEGFLRGNADRYSVELLLGDGEILHKVPYLKELLKRLLREEAVPEKLNPPNPRRKEKVPSYAAVPSAEEKAEQDRRVKEFLAKPFMEQVETWEGLDDSGRAFFAGRNEFRYIKGALWNFLRLRDLGENDGEVEVILASLGVAEARLLQEPVGSRVSETLAARIGDLISTKEKKRQEMRQGKASVPPMLGRAKQPPGAHTGDKRKEAPKVKRDFLKSPRRDAADE